MSRLWRAGAHFSICHTFWDSRPLRSPLPGSQMLLLLTIPLSPNLRASAYIKVSLMKLPPLLCKPALPEIIFKIIFSVEAGSPGLLWVEAPTILVELLKLLRVTMGDCAFFICTLKWWKDNISILGGNHLWGRVRFAAQDGSIPEGATGPYKAKQKHIESVPQNTSLTFFFSFLRQSFIL